MSENSEDSISKIYSACVV